MCDLSAKNLLESSQEFFRIWFIDAFQYVIDIIMKAISVLG